MFARSTISIDAQDTDSYIVDVIRNPSKSDVDYADSDEDNDDDIMKHR